MRPPPQRQRPGTSDFYCHRRPVGFEKGRAPQNSWASIKNELCDLDGQGARQHKELTLDFDVLTRISLVLGIYSALRCLYISEAAGLEWLRSRNNVPAFGGQPPMTLVTSGSLDALFEVRQFLDGARGGLFIAPNEADIDFSPYTDANIFWS